jgi:hypothetical protein
MAEKLNLNKYKASGVYTVEIDESTNLSLPLSTGRLVIGSSKKGPINSVVLINDTRTLSAVYGDKDYKFEKNGSYFHRTIETTLRNGPVYALNVVPLQDTDLAYFTTFNTESASNNAVWSSADYVDSISKFYNTQKLWYAEASQVSKTKNLALGDTYPASGTVDKDSNKVISLVNLTKKPVTAWIRIADTTGYNITVKDYYKLLGDKVQVPEMLHPDDFISDYFVELIVVEGDWTDTIKLSKDPIYKQYFSKTGLNLAKLDSFMALREVTVLNRTIGCMIPDFSDLGGSAASIDFLFNRKFSQSGLFCALDDKKIDMMDLTNETFSSGTSTEPVAEQRIDLIGHGFDELNGLVYAVDDGISELSIDPVKKIDVLSYKKPAHYDFNFLLDDENYSSTFAAGETYIFSPISGDKYIVATQDSKLYTAWAEGFIKTGDVLHYLAAPSSTPTDLYIQTDDLVKTQTIGNIKYIIFNVFADSLLTNQVDAEYVDDGDGGYFLNIVTATKNQYKAEFDLTDSDYFITSGAYNYKYFAPNQVVFTLAPELYGNTSRGEVANVGFAYDSTKRGLVDSFFKPGQYIKAEITEVSGTPVIRDRVLRIKTVYAKPITTTYGPSSTPIKSLQYTVTTESPSADSVIGIDLADVTVKAYIGIKNYLTTLKGFSMPAMSMDESQLYPNGLASRQDDILDYMFNDSNLASTLSDRETLDFRYIIDSFEGQISPSSKQQLAQLAANHGQALAILNAPSFAQYEKSIDPSFIDYTTNLVSSEYIATGGNISSNPSFTFGFADGDKDGIPISSFAMYTMPNLIIFEGGKNKSIPPAAYIGNAYMRKYASGNTFSIVAGKRGIITEAEVVGVEYDLTDEDRAFLEPAGFNLIVRRRGFGVMIFSNNTAYQRVKSALNNVHVREALITVERDINRILLNFLFDYNDPTTRLRVKTLVDNYLLAVQDARGIASFEIVFDDSNNGTEVLENNAGIIDIIIDFPRGIQKFINRITITRAGGQLASQSTGFTPSF